jgi:hypothetical protein
MHPFGAQVLELNPKEASWKLNPASMGRASRPALVATTPSVDGTAAIAGDAAAPLLCLSDAGCSSPQRAGKPIACFYISIIVEL